MWYQSIELLLASQSPRRKALLGELGISYRTIPQDAEEDFASDTLPELVPGLLAQRKAEAAARLFGVLAPGQYILSADTVVILGQEILGKPQSAEEAKAMLAKLSGRRHRVITAFCLRGAALPPRIFSDTAYVDMAVLSQEEIDFYVEGYQPLDKAGSYAIQEWIGLAAIEKIEGSYYTIVGLPTALLYRSLRDLQE